jgi:hypothetical protein
MDLQAILGSPTISPRLPKIPYKEIYEVLDITEYQIWWAKHHRLTPQKARKQQSKLKTPQKFILLK